METEDKEIRGLIDDFKKHPGQFMFFLGAGFSSEIGLPIGKELADMLKKSFEEKGSLQKGADDTEEMGLDSLITLLLNKGISRDVICAEIKKILEGKRNPATNISGEDFFGLFYKIITEAVDKSQTPGQICIATTNWDEALSEVFGDKALSIYSGNEVVKRKEIESKRIVIYQLHGSIKDCKSLLLTNEDKSQIKEKERILWDSFKADADKRRIIFIGYSLSDEDILDVYFKARTGLENIREKDFIIVNREESKKEIEERLSKNNLKDVADVRVLNAFNFLIEMKESMGLDTGEETIELQTEGKINEKLENGVIVAGYPLSGLTTLYLKYYSRLPDRKLCIERYKHNPYDKNSFTDIINGLRKGQKVALFIPEYTFEVYLDEYLEEHQNELQTDLKKDIKKYVVNHTVSKKEANKFLEKLIHKSNVKEKFDNDLKEAILNLVKQTEKHGSRFPRNRETYPLKLLKDVFERTQKRLVNNEQPNKIKKDLDRKIEVKDETEKLLDAGILLGMTQVGEEAPNLLRLIPQDLYEKVKQLSPSITFLLGIATPLALALVAVASILLEIKEYLKHRGEKKTTQLDKYLQLKEYWDSLSDSERKMLCYKLDKANKLKPGASEIYLNYIFMDRWNEVEKEVNEIKNKLDGFEDRLKALEADYQKIMESLNELSKINPDISYVKDEIESLKKIITEVDIRASGLNQVDDIKTLQEYYNVDPKAIADIYNEFEITDGSEGGNRSKMRFSSLIEELWNWDESKPGVYVITGPSGTGKSWFTYRVISEIFNRNEEEERLTGRNRFAFFKITSPDRFRYPVIIESGERGLLFIDDSQIEVDKIDQFEKILHEFLEQDNRTSPIIITIEYIKWERLLRKKIKSLEISNLNTKKDKLEKKLRQIFLQRTSEAEILKVLESLSKSTGISIPEELKGKIVEKAAGLPIIIKILMESIEKKKSKEITKSDVEDIDNDPTEYAAKKLEGYYLPERWRDDPIGYRGEISKVLSLLNAILKLNKPLPLAFLDINFLKKILNYDEKNKILLYEILNINDIRNLINITIENNKLQVRMLFFQLDEYGFLKPMHDIVRGGIDNLIKKYKKYNVYPEEEKEIVYNFNILFNQKIDEIFKEIDEIFKGAEFKTIGVLDAYYLLSLSIIKDNTDYQIKALEFASKLSENIDLLYSQIIARLENILVDKSKSVPNWISENLIEKLLKINDQGDRLKIWDLCCHRKAISKKVLVKNKSYFIELLSSKNSIRWRAWRFVLPELIGIEIISIEDIVNNKKYFIELLSSEDENIRWRMWRMARELIKYGIITKKDVMNNKKCFIELLSSKYRIRLQAWDDVCFLIKYGIITKKDVMNNKKCFIELLISAQSDAAIKLEIGNVISKLIECGIFDKDVMNNKDNFEYLIKELIKYEGYS